MAFSLITRWLKRHRVIDHLNARAGTCFPSTPAAAAAGLRRAV
ncbi:hypothetical protein [Halochromatium salexigens]|nr:hypothetical protein [Halochromatium salexigens]